MKEETNQQSKLTSTSSCSLEVEELFQLIYQEKIEELISFILNEKNEIWNIKRGDDITILHSACVLDKTYIIETIIDQTKKRLKLNSKDSLSNEEKIKNENIFKNFINAKTNADGLTALHFASFRGNIKIIKLLILNNAEINALSYNGLNMIHKAAQGNKPSAIIYFNKKYNMDLNATDNNNKLNALHLATISGMDNSVIFLLSLGVDPNVQDSKGYTALHYAVKFNHIRIIKKLLQRGADKNILEQKYNKSPIMMARKKPEIMELFRNKGICEKLFLKPDITKKTFYSNKNIIIFLFLNITIMFLSFFIIMPYFYNSAFSIIYLIISLTIFGLYIPLSFSNPGIMKNTEYTDLLDIVERGEEVDNFCSYCLVKKEYKSKHCLICQNCVREFDHHCFWVGNCIGKNNYTLFFIFLVYVNLNILFNFGIACYYFITEIAYPQKEIDNNNFPGFCFGINSFIYNKYLRIFFSIFIITTCISAFIPLIKLFKNQLKIAIEKRRNRIDEEECEKKNKLNEKLNEKEENNYNEIKVQIDNMDWGDIVFRKGSIENKALI